MENALQQALKQALTSNPAMFDDEPSAQATPTTSPQPSTPKETIMQNTPKLGDKVNIIYSALVQHPDISALDLETMLKGQGHAWWDSVSSQLHQLHERGLVVRVKRAREDASQGPRRVYRYWPIANTYEDAVSARKEAQRNKAETPPKTTSFPINKKKAVKEKATQGLVPVQAYAKLPQEVVEEPRQKIMLRVGGFDAKAQVERMSVVEARAVYAELKAIFG
jgi:predicted transcriptional regulator